MNKYIVGMATQGFANYILKAFPGLRYDGGFRITSPENADYNCIAWAFGRKDCWLWPDEMAEGVDVWLSFIPTAM